MCWTFPGVLLSLWCCQATSRDCQEMENKGDLTCKWTLLRFRVTDGSIVLPWDRARLAVSTFDAKWREAYLPNPDNDTIVASICSSNSTRMRVSVFYIWVKLHIEAKVLSFIAIFWERSSGYILYFSTYDLSPQVHHRALEIFVCFFWPHTLLFNLSV